MKKALTLTLLLMTCGLPSWAQEPFKAVSTMDAPAIQGRPVELDKKGKLLPWPSPQGSILRE